MQHPKNVVCDGAKCEAATKINWTNSFQHHNSSVCSSFSSECQKLIDDKHSRLLCFCFRSCLSLWIGSQKASCDMLKAQMLKLQPPKYAADCFLKIEKLIDWRQEGISSDCTKRFVTRFDVILRSTKKSWLSWEFSIWSLRFIHSCSPKKNGQVFSFPQTKNKLFSLFSSLSSLLLLLLWTLLSGLHPASRHLPAFMPLCTMAFYSYVMFK